MPGKRKVSRKKLGRVVGGGRGKKATRRKKATRKKARRKKTRKKARKKA